MVKRLLFLCFLLLPPFTYSYEFIGKHFIASYKKCESDILNNGVQLLSEFATAIAKSGATIISCRVKGFESGGFTFVFLLSESHASIHTYPEHNSCFIDLFFCGDNCDWEEFDAYLSLLLKPNEKNYQIIDRE